MKKNGYIVRTPMENDARLKRIELTQKALDHEKQGEGKYNGNRGSHARRLF